MTRVRVSMYRPDKKYHVLSIIIFLGSWHTALCQELKTLPFYDSIQAFDLSTLWRADSILNLEQVDDAILSDPVKLRFPEPLGFIGDNFQRFYIHFLSVAKSTSDPYTYFVTGKTRVENNISRFSGTISIRTANTYTDSTKPNYKQGYVVCHCLFYEDSTNKQINGHISGTLITDWLIINQHIYYDNVDGVADGYSNNQFTGRWKSYDRKWTKKCNWGDYRIPQSTELDMGAGEFSPGDKYLKYGWQTYRDADFQNDTVIKNKAVRIENEQWWR